MAEGQRFVALFCFLLQPRARSSGSSHRSRRTATAPPAARVESRRTASFPHAATGTRSARTARARAPSGTNASDCPCARPPPAAEFSGISRDDQGLIVEWCCRCVAWRAAGAAFGAGEARRGSSILRIRRYSHTPSEGTPVLVARERARAGLAAAPRTGPGVPTIRRAMTLATSDIENSDK